MLRRDMNQENESEELLKIFLEEARDLLDALSATLQQWSTDLNNKTSFSNLKRDLHTLKGGARMVSQSKLSMLAHELETFCESLLTGNVTADKNSYDLVCKGQDRMNVIVEALSKKEAPPDVEDLIMLFKQMMTGAAAVAVAVEPIALKTNPKIEEKSKAEALPNEVIRVRSELLEKLNNLSIESNIIRVNLMHYVENFKTNLSEVTSLSKSLHEKFRDVSKGTNLHATSEVLGLVSICKNLSQTYSNIEALLSQQSRIGLELQERLIDTRMVPFNSVVPRLGRITRQVAAELGKKIEFSVLQAEGEIDRNLLEHVTPSLEHLLRNALDHGIETPLIRQQHHKPETGTINLRFFRMGNEACMEISDDGAGIDIEAVRRKAIKLGLLSEETICSDEEIIRFIFEPGFSTRDAVSEISGRGVGMDVVNTVVKGLGGNLSIESRFGIGTKFIIRLPFTTSMNRSLLVVVQDQTFGILLSSVESIVSVPIKDIKEALSRHIPLKYNNKEYHLKYLGGTLGIQDKPVYPHDKDTLPVLFFNFADYNAALLVDSLVGSQEVVVQALGPQFQLMDIFSGATLLADGRVLIILDAYSITTKARKQMDETPELRRPDKRQPVVMVVDDSVTIRTVTKNFLERHKYTVVTAKDGLDAIGKLAENKPDVILLDVEMPRMDGFQFAEKVRQDPSFLHLPIIMITFCTGEEERNRAFKLGIDKFISKPYREPELLEAIGSLLDRG